MYVFEVRCGVFVWCYSLSVLCVLVFYFVVFSLSVFCVLVFYCECVCSTGVFVVVCVWCSL